MKTIVSIFVICLLVTLTSYSQNKLAPLVKAKVTESEIMFKKVVYRRMDMEEKQNRPYFTPGFELSALLINAVEEGLITPYRTDSCVNFMPDIVFVSNISIEQEESIFESGGDEFGTEFPDDENLTDLEEEVVEKPPTLVPIPSELFSVIYIREDVIFDKTRSRMYNYIRAISLYLPASAGSEFNPGGFEKAVAHFKYEDILDLFRGPYAESALYFNNANQGAHLNMTEAFELRLFNAPIVKLSNDQNLDIRQIYVDEIAKNPLSAIIIQQTYEHDLLTYESELWEY